MQQLAKHSHCLAKPPGRANHFFQTAWRNRKFCWLGVDGIINLGTNGPLASDSRRLTFITVFNIAL